MHILYMIFLNKSFTLNHVISGGGIPMTGQLTSSEDPRTTDKFPADTELGSILGGTVNYEWQ